MVIDLMRKNPPMEQTNVRLPSDIRRRARKLAEERSKSGNKVTESDVYRTAIVLFLDRNFTDSKGGDAHPQTCIE